MSKKPCRYCGRLHKKSGHGFIKNMGEHERTCPQNPNGVPQVHLTEDERSARDEEIYQENCRAYAENPRLFRKTEIELTDSISIWV